MRTFLALGLALGWLCSGALAHADDSDGDGVDDALEQALSTRLRPRFLVSARECAGRPAEFESNSLEPRVKERNATIYVRVSPSTVLGPDVSALEVHFYHLWARDCGRLNFHALDVEHVSALVVAPSPAASPDEWKARYWYAAAHEGTVCDTSHAARADALDAVERGPRVWISEGKHASYLREELCRERGCGGDRCRDMVELAQGPLRNLGEAGRPLDGAVWMASEAWPLPDKLGPDFDRELVERLEASAKPVLARVNGQWRPMHFAISIGGDTLGALGEGGRHGHEGVAHASEETGSAFGRSLRAIGRSLGHTARALGLK